jgi:hypothetical protein
MATIGLNLPAVASTIHARPRRRASFPHLLAAPVRPRGRRTSGRPWRTSGRPKSVRWPDPRHGASRAPRIRPSVFRRAAQRPYDLIGKRAFAHNAVARSAVVRDSSKIVPTFGRPNPRSLVVSQRLLPPAALGPLPDRIGRHAQQLGRLPVGKPLTRQNVPRRSRRRTPSRRHDRRGRDFNSSWSQRSRQGARDRL